VEALLDCGGKRSATPLSAAPVQPKAPSSLRSAGALQIRRLDLRTPHLRRVRELVDLAALRRARLRVAHDAMHGVGAGCFEVLLAGTGVRLTPRRAAHDCLFGGVAPEPIARNYAATSAWLARHPHDLCLVTDGDADRLGAMDGRGRPLSTHQVICLLLDHLVRSRGQRGRVVTALTTTSLVPKLCAEHGLAHTEVSVGFKHTAAELAKGDVLLGAEESGGIGFAGHIPERDGLLAGMILLEAVAAAGISVNRMIAALERRFGPHRYARLDARFQVERRAALMARLAADPPARLLRSPVERVQTFDGVKCTARDGSWLAFRGSGTEPVLRIYAEADSDAKAARLLEAGRRLVAGGDGTE
jgi:phosphomannomutase